MGNELSLSEIRSREIEDGSKDALSVLLAEVFGEAAIVVDVGYD